MNDDFASYSERDLLRFYVGILGELRNRTIIRSTNNPVADYAELLVARALNLKLAAKSSTGFDAIDNGGRRFEVKARRLTSHNTSRQLSVIRGIEKQHFDLIAGVLFLEDFSVHRACLIPHEVVSQVAIHRKHVNGWVVHLRDSVWNLPGVVDITAKLQAVECAK